MKQRGGKRPGAGRPKGSGSGRVLKQSSIYLPESTMTKLDQLKGHRSRSAWIEGKVEDNAQEHTTPRTED